MERLLIDCQCYTCLVPVNIDDEGFFVCPVCGATWKE
jgi:hypothetical protein